MLGTAKHHPSPFFPTLLSLGTMEKKSIPNDQFLKVALQGLIHEIGGPCLSMTIPFEKLNPQREANKRLLEELLTKASNAAPSNYSESLINKILEKVVKLCEKIDWVHSPSGLGIYSSEKQLYKVALDFTPKERIYWGERFMVRELLFQDQLDQPFFILTLTETKSRFYEYNSGQCRRVSDSNLNCNYQPNYVYESPARSTSHAGHAHVKSFEREKDKLNSAHRKPHLNKIKIAIRKYQSATQPLVIIGIDKLQQEMNMTHSLQEPVIKISKDPSHFSPVALAKLATPYVYEFFEHRIEKMIAEWNELVGKGFTRTGLQASWRAAQEGNCRILLVEKDFVKPGFLLEDPFHLTLSPPIGNHITLPDAVDDLIKLVLLKDGTVFFTEDHLLEQMQRIALITRY